MNMVTVSPKHQVEIPLSVRKSLGIQSGKKVPVLQYESRIEQIPLREITKMWGFLKEINTSVKRENEPVWNISEKIEFVFLPTDIVNFQPI